MTSTDQMKTALLTEHFRYTPLTLLDDIINTVNELVFQAVNAIEESLLNADVENLGFSKEDGSTDLDTKARTEIEAGIVQLESLLNATIDRNFDKLEIYTLRNLLTVSNLKEDEGLENWVMLDHYTDIKDAQQMPSDGPTPDSIAILRRKVQETEKLQVVLRAEAARNEAILAKLRPLSLESTSVKATRRSLLESSSPARAADQGQPSLSFLTSTPAAETLGIKPNNTGHPLALNTKFALSQLPALKALLEELRPHIKSVPEGAQASEAVQRRADYIESQSKRAMMRKGIDPDVSATVGAENAGRSIGGDEVRALEAIVGTTGGEGHNVHDYDRMEE